MSARKYGGTQVRQHACVRVSRLLSSTGGRAVAFARSFRPHALRNRNESILLHCLAYRRAASSPTLAFEQADCATHTARRYRTRRHQTGNLLSDPRARRVHTVNATRFQKARARVRTHHQDRDFPGPNPLAKASTKSSPPSRVEARVDPRSRQKKVSCDHRPTLQQVGSMRQWRSQSAFRTWSVHSSGSKHTAVSFGWSARSDHNRHPRPPGLDSR